LPIEDEGVDTPRFGGHALIIDNGGNDRVRRIAA
jgi:hypothetical protein